MGILTISLGDAMTMLFRAENSLCGVRVSWLIVRRARDVCLRANLAVIDGPETMEAKGFLVAMCC